MTGGAKGRRSAVRALVGSSAALVFAGALAACAPADTGLQHEAASHLQQRVLSVTQAAAANDHAAALQALDGLEGDLASAAGNGQVSEDRRRTIMTSIAAVRGDLTAAVQAAEAAAAKAAEEAAAAAAAAEAEKAAAETQTEAAQDSAAPVVPAPGPAQGPAQAPAQDQGKGSEGKAKGKNG